MSILEWLGFAGWWDALGGIAQALLAIILIIALAFVGLRVMGPAVDRLFRAGDAGMDERRAKTLNDLVRSVIRYTVYFFAFVAILDQLGVDTRSLIAGAGILGLAVGFGAQNLVQDVVSGFFILLEDQYAVGDYVTVSGISGIVESVGIRTTKIRDFGGQLHILPNGKIDTVTNHMGPAMRVMFPVRIPYEEDVDRAIDVLEELFTELAGELEDILEGPRVLGVNDLGDSGVELLVWARAKPMTQFAMTRELRRRVKKRLDERGIAIPYSRRYIVFDGGRGPGGLTTAQGPGGEPPADAGGERVAQGG